MECFSGETFIDSRFFEPLVLLDFIFFNLILLQTATVKEYPDEVTVVFLFCCFGTIQSAVFTILLERNTDVWILDTRTEWVSIVFAVSKYYKVFTCVFFLSDYYKFKNHDTMS